MFTGIVQETGRLAGRRDRRLRFESPGVSADARAGASVAVNGCCLTVVAAGDGWWEADVVDETLSRTNLGGLAVGDPVNLERPVRVGDRLDGHIVTGHVDCVGRVATPAPELRVEVGDTRLLAEKGSVCVEGVSLTLVHVDAGSFTVAVVPHTAAVTTLGRLRPGAPVNVEFDLVARYVARLVEPSGPGR